MRKTMNHSNIIKIGNSELTIHRMGLGCMGMSDFYGPSDERKNIETLNAALDLGVDFFDTADMYGVGHNETLLGKTFAGRWDQLTIATKFGVVRGNDGSWMGICGKPDYVKSACENSLKRLGIDTIDLYYMHRPDPETEIEETVGAMRDLVYEGKVRTIGLSEVDAETLRRAHAVHPINALQTEYSLWTREPYEAVIDTCRELGITFVAYSPLGRGFLTGKLDPKQLDSSDWRLTGERIQGENLRKNQVFIEIVGQIAQQKGITLAQVALAWVLQSEPNLAAIPGTRSVERLKENLAALEVELTTEELAYIHSHLPSETAGARYPKS